MAEQNWFGVSTPFHFGFPTFEVSAIISMCIVALVIMTETTGDMLAVGEIVGKHVEPRQLADGLRADGLSTVLGGVFNTFPYTAFAQNVGLVSMTGVKSRYVATFAGGVLIILGLLPKLGGDRRGHPAAGARRRRHRPVRHGGGQRRSGRCPGCTSTTSTSWWLRSPSGSACCRPSPRGCTSEFPVGFQIIFDSGISAGAMVAILLNLLLNSEAAQRRGVADSVDHAPHDAIRSPAADVDIEPSRNRDA